MPETSTPETRASEASPRRKPLPRPLKKNAPTHHAFKKRNEPHGTLQEQIAASRSGQPLRAGGAATTPVGPVTVEPDNAPFDPGAEPRAGETAIFDDRIVHLARTAVADHRARGAEAAGNRVVGAVRALPWAEGHFAHGGKAGDAQVGIPVGRFLLSELGGDRMKRLPAFAHLPVVARAGEPEVQFQRVGRAGAVGCRHRAEGRDPHGENLEPRRGKSNGNVTWAVDELANVAAKTYAGLVQRWYTFV